MENIIDLDYKHAERVWKDFGIRNVSDYHDLCVKSDTLLLEDVIENFRIKCFEIYEPFSKKCDIYGRYGYINYAEPHKGLQQIPQKLTWVLNKTKKQKKLWFHRC